MESTDLTRRPVGTGADRAATERDEDAVRSRKRRLRNDVLTARRGLDVATLAERARRLAEHVLAVDEVCTATTVAAYVSTGSEPGTGPLLDALTARGVRVLLPVLLPDDDLDWAPYEGPEALRPATRGLLEPVATPLGVDAVRRAEVLLVPGLAVSPTGLRTGRGGGSYDRVLARLGSGTFSCVLLHPGEVGLDVPAEPHDRPVDAAATADGITRFG